LPKHRLSKLFESFKRSGVNITKELHDLPSQANFCGKKLVETARGYWVLVDPVELLGKSMWWLGCDASSGKRDAELQTAKAVGYLVNYHGLPLIHAFCCGVIRKNRKVADGLLSAVEHYGDAPPTTLSRAAISLLHDTLTRHGSTHVPTGIDLDKLMATTVDDALREAVRHIHSELLPQAQVECEREITEAIGAGRAAVLPVLGLIGSRLKGYSAMSQHYFEGKREQAHQFADTLQTQAMAAWASTTVAAGAWWSSVMAWLCAFTCPVIGPVGFVWMWFTGCNILMGLFATFIISALVWLGAFFSALALGFSLANARRISSTTMWFMLVSSIIKWALVCRASYTAVCEASHRIREVVLLCVQWSPSSFIAALRSRAVVGVASVVASHPVQFLSKVFSK
jgi:hypothetical protein